jgi:hypothetical protein
MALAMVVGGAMDKTRGCDTDEDERGPEQKSSLKSVGRVDLTEGRPTAHTEGLKRARTAWTDTVLIIVIVIYISHY